MRLSFLVQSLSLSRIRCTRFLKSIRRRKISRAKGFLLSSSLLSLVGFFPLGWTARVYAKEGPPFTLDALLHAVAQESPELVSRRAEIAAAKERPAQARAFEDPTISAELWQVPVSGNQVPLMITLRQPIPWPGKLRARAQVAESEVGIATAREHGSKRQVILEATRAYYDYWFSVRSIKTLHDNQQLLSVLNQSISARYRVGKAELIEVLKIKQAEFTLGNNLLDLERQRQIAMTRINVLLARPSDSLVGEPITTPDVQDLPAQQVLLEKALGHRPNIEEAQAQITQAQARVEAARIERRPDFAVWGGYMHQLRGGADNTFTVGVQMSIPSFSLGRHNAAAREAMAQTNVHRATLRQTQARIQGEVQTTFLRLDTARRHLDLHRQTLIPLSERSVEAAKASYETGKVPLSFVLEAIQTLIMHRLEYEQFLAEYGQGLAELEAAIGGPLSESTPSTSISRRLP